MQQRFTFRIGDMTITRIPEQSLEHADISTLFPYADANALKASALHWGERLYNAAEKRLRLSVHAWLIKTPSLTVLIDTGLGNDKDRPQAPIFGHLKTPFIEHLNAEGVTPDDVDLVLITHLHVDHVGWNSSLHDALWQPTFPNARYVFSRREYDYNAALSVNDAASVQREVVRAGLGAPHHYPIEGVFNDSVLPIMAAGQAQLIEAGATVEGFTFHASPGHSIAYASISVVSQGHYALFWGDVMHHPLQVHHPEVNSQYCEFLPAALRSRQRMMAHALAHDATIFTSHFGDSGVGRLASIDGGYDWAFEPGISI